jgi:hypothetical protein
LVLLLILLQFVYLFCNQSKCILLFFSCISFMLLFLFWFHLLQTRENILTQSKTEKRIRSVTKFIFLI